jgi:hypothetical protein
MGRDVGTVDGKKLYAVIGRLGVLLWLDFHVEFLHLFKICSYSERKKLKVIFC